MTNTFRSAEINSLSDLIKSLQAVEKAFLQKPDRITFVDTLRLVIDEVTLTDGSTVYDARIVED